MLKDSCIFEHQRWPSIDSEDLATYGDEAIKRLLDHFKTILGYLGCECDKVMREWLRLKRKVMRDPTLKSLKYADLYERLFDQSSEKASSQDLYNILLLVLLVMTYAVDTSICERGFARNIQSLDRVLILRRRAHLPPISVSRSR